MESLGWREEVGGCLKGKLPSAPTLSSFVLCFTPLLHHRHPLPSPSSFLLLPPCPILPPPSSLLPPPSLYPPLSPPNLVSRTLAGILILHRGHYSSWYINDEVCEILAGKIKQTPNPLSSCKEPLLVKSGFVNKEPCNLLNLSYEEWQNQCM
jgi:hypothetical protein